MDQRRLLLLGSRNARAGMDRGPRVRKVSRLRASGRTPLKGISMSLLSNSNRREFLRGAALTGAGLALSNRLLAAKEKKVLVFTKSSGRSEEHTSELQSRLHLVCRLLLEKKKKNKNATDRACCRIERCRT